MKKFKYKKLWKGCLAAWCPSITGPTGSKLWNFIKGNHGTLTNMDVSTDWVRSNGKYALDFDGIDDKCPITPMSMSQKHYTISLWFYARTVPASPNTPQLFVEHTTNNGYGRCGVTITNTSGVYYPSCGFRDAANDPTGTSIGLISTIPITLNSWNHVCVIFSTTQSIYVNGKLGNSATNSFTGFAATTPANALFGQGNYAAGNNNLFNGMLDDMRIYNRILSSQEITILASKRGAAYEQEPIIERIETKRITEPFPTLRTTELQGQVIENTWDYQYPKSWDGCVYASCPSISGPTGLKLFDYARANNGTLTNMAAASDWVRSNGKYALDFDGTDDFVNLGTGSAMQPTKAITLSAWAFRSSSQAAGDNGYILSKPKSDATPWYDYALISSKTQFKGQLRLSSGNVSLEYTTTTDDRWHHISLTYDGSTVKLFIDGIERLSTSATGDIQYYTGTSFGGNKVLIGRWTETLVNQFQGQIDDVRIYNRALSPSEISLLAKSRGIAYKKKRIRRCSPITHPSQSYIGTTFNINKYKQLFHGRVGAWCPSATGPTGNTVFDLSGRNSHGTREVTTMTWDRDEGKYCLDNYNQGTGTNIGYSRVLCKDNAQFNFKSNAVSLVGWGKYMSAGSASRMFAAQHSTSYMLRIGCDASGFTYGQITGSGGVKSLTGTTSVIGTGWHHYALVSSSYGSFLYIDGKIEASSTELTGDSNYANNGGEMTLGAYSTPTLNNAWPGRFDDIAIYNRAITPAEVVLLYKMGRGGLYHKNILDRVTLGNSYSSTGNLVCGISRLLTGVG